MAATIAGNSVGVRPYIALSGNAEVHANLSSPRWAPPPWVGLNPEVIEKQRFHPSLLKGILSNMRWLERTVAPQYHVVLSSRTRIFAPLHAHTLEAAMNQNPQRDMGMDHMPHDQWPTLNTTRFADVILRRGGKFVVGGHEGLVFDRYTVRAMLAFLDAHLPTEPELLSCDVLTSDGKPGFCCLEEFVLHTLALHVGGRFGRLLAGGGGVPPPYAVAIQVLREPGFWWPPVYGVPSATHSGENAGGYSHVA